MKSLQKIISLVLSFILLITTSSFSIDKHYCDSKLVAVSFFGKAPDCGMDSGTKTSQGCNLEKANCCSENTFIHQADDTYYNTDKHIGSEIDYFVFLPNFYISFINKSSFTTLHFKEYSPPAIKKCLYKVHSVFLI